MIERAQIPTPFRNVDYSPSEGSARIPNFLLSLMEEAEAGGTMADYCGVTGCQK